MTQQRLGKWYNSSQESDAALNLVSSHWQLAEAVFTYQKLQLTLMHAANRLYYSVSEGQYYSAVLLQLTSPSADVVYFHVNAEMRRRGLGKKILKESFDDLYLHEGVRDVFLEVKPDNVAARYLYASMGFAEIGRRQNYYQSGEDALLLRLILGAPDDET